MAKEKVTKFFEQRISEWLEEEMKKDVQFAERVQSCKGKTVEGACNYVLSVAKESCKAGWTDEEVYGLVRHFYDEDEVKDPGKVDVQKIIVSGEIDLTEEEKAKAIERAQQEYLEEIRKAEAEKMEKQRKAEEERKKRLKEKREKEMAIQQDLFGGF